MQFLGIKKWCSANIFPDTKQKHVCWKICIVRKIFCCVSYILFSLPNEVSVNPVIFVPFFCWLWVFLLENLKSKKLWWCPLERLGKYKKVYTRNNIFKKGISNMRFWIIYILVQISFFFSGTTFGCFSRSFFLLFVVNQPWWSTFLLSVPCHKKASYGPVTSYYLKSRNACKKSILT